MDLPEPHDAYGPWIRRADHDGWPTSLLSNGERICILTDKLIGQRDRLVGQAKGFSWRKKCNDTDITHWALAKDHPLYSHGTIRALIVDADGPQRQVMEQLPVWGMF